MGVMRCDRKKCESIMCDRYSEEYGYICDECFSELENDESGISIKDFMETAKVDRLEKEKKYDEIFKTRPQEEF